MKRTKGDAAPGVVIPLPAKASPSRAGQALPHKAKKSPEEILEEAWSFGPDPAFLDKRIFNHSDIVSLSAIASARALIRIADDVEAIKKHVTRLQLVHRAEGASSSAQPVESATPSDAVQE